MYVRWWYKVLRGLIGGNSKFNKIEANFAHHHCCTCRSVACLQYILGMDVSKKGWGVGKSIRMGRKNLVRGAGDLNKV
jgi:hypothetical protein